MFSPHHNDEKSSRQHIPKNPGFLGTAQQHADLSPLDFYLWGSGTPRFIHLQLKMKEHFTNAFLTPVKPTARAYGLLQVRDSP